MDPSADIAMMVLGDGGYSVICKLAAEKKDRQQRALTAGLSAVGGTAGAGGLAYSAAKIRGAMRPAPRHAMRTVRALAKPGLRGALKAEKGAALLFPLEVAGLGGEVMSTKILSNDVKKKTPVVKMEPGNSDVHVPTMGQLKRVAAKKAYAKGKPIAMEAGQKTYDKAMGAVCKSVSWEGEITKIDEDKRQVFGWASIVEVDGKPVVDLQGDYIDIDEVEKSAYEYVIKSRKGGDMHRRNTDGTPVHSSDMIESFIVTPEKKASMGLPEDTPTGWWVGYQINDEDAWQMVKSGERTAFSIHGRGVRTPMEV